jgi:cytochrome b involved in lipid metabolism
MAQVATHATITNCWTVLNGNVYNLTAFMSQHPGGTSVLVPACGKDGTSIFEGRHGTDPSYTNALATYLIGTLV